MVKQPYSSGAAIKPIFWVGSSRKDLRDFPEQVRDVIGHALHVAQLGGRHPDVKPLKGFGGAGVLEIADDFGGATFRTVYTVRLSGAIVVLHSFRKKSRSGISTPKEDSRLIRERLKTAESHHEIWARSRG